MSNHKENFARIGIATKGIVYFLIGALTAAAAIGRGGQKTDSSGVLEFLAQQTFGQILLIATIVGLCGYVFWKVYQAFADPEDKGSDFKGIATRIGYFFSGIFYGFLIFSAVKILVNAGSGSGGGKESMIQTLLTKPFGQILVGIVAAAILGKAIYQIYLAYSEKYRKKINASGLGEKARTLVINAGKIGFTARGVVVGIISFLTFRAAMSANSEEAGGTKDAFEFLQNTFGSIVLLVIAIGLLAYGVFMFVTARYREMVMK